MTIRHDYEVSSEGAVRHWEFTKTRLENATPVITEPFAVLSVLPGTQICGTVLTMEGLFIIGDVTHSMVYKHYVRNVLTYVEGAEATFGPINEGDPIYYDRSATMPANCYLSTSPLDAAGVANPLWGHAVLENDADVFPKGDDQEGVTLEFAVMQEGA